MRTRRGEAIAMADDDEARAPGDAPSEEKEPKTPETETGAPAEGELPAEGDFVLPMPLPDRLPSRLILQPIEDIVFFPGMMMPVLGATPEGQATIRQAMTQSAFLGLVTRLPESEGETDGHSVTERLYCVGCAGRIVQRVGGAGEIGAIVQGLRRFRVEKWVRTEPVLIAQVSYPEEIVRDPKEAEALERVIRREVRELVALRPDIPNELTRAIEAQHGPARLVDFLSGHLGLPVEERQSLLETFEVDSRLRRIMAFFERELDLARIGKKVRADIRAKVEKQQRDFYLREQLKALRKELGEEVDEKEIETETYEEKIAKAKMPPEVEKRARYELKRLAVLPQEAAEYHVIRTYLDWLVELPWSVSFDDTLDVKRAAKILDEDHHGLEEVKARIVEFLAVRKLVPERQGAILCLVGPPGVGKTSLGKSVARATGRKFYRVSLGGMRDEAEIKGHRRTYVGAMPGKIIQGLRRVAANNPIFMLDEIDKLGSDWRGDPSSAMLEVLDPAQNNAFEDHYLDVPFDLSKVMFIATANYAGQIPQPLIDRMEMIQIPGYILAEKRAIASRYLIPRQLEAHGLDRKRLRIPFETIRAIVEGYTREAGVRELERKIAQICRKVAAGIATGEASPRKIVTVRPEGLKDYLGPAPFDKESELRVRRPGVVTGLAWTPTGGEVLFIEARQMPGKGIVKVTGQIGQVMNESIEIAWSIVRGEAARFDIDPKVFTSRDFHVHVPAGAVPKDGPSAGVTMTTALVSLLARQGKGIRVSRKLAMTGEITLSGAVLPVGGIREKVVAGKRAGIKTILLPARNRGDLEEVPERVRRGIRFAFAETLDDVIREALPELAESDG